MKNYVIGVLVVIILVLTSLLYKNNETTVDKRFPVMETSHPEDVEVPLFLFVFFSKKNCIDCMEFIEVLNELESHFVVSGIVPENEIGDEEEIRRLTGATFPLVSASRYRKFVPFYTPAVMGVSPKGDIVFLLPGVPGEKEYIRNFLGSLYQKLYPIFLQEKLEKNRT